MSLHFQVILDELNERPTKITYLLKGFNFQTFLEAGNSMLNLNRQEKSKLFFQVRQLSVSFVIL